jgi:hypothetical protein
VVALCPGCGSGNELKSICLQGDCGRRDPSHVTECATGAERRDRGGRTRLVYNLIQLNVAQALGAVASKV